MIGYTFNPVAVRMAKTLWSFGHSEYGRVKGGNSGIFYFCLIQWQLVKERKMELNNIFFSGILGYM